ncbi:unnamed protein product [Lathyrus sativus]|nr:unnamed protein product [Lathyrus sativus]
MNLITYNIKGCGTSIKRQMVCQLILGGNVDVYFIQESKIQNMTDSLVKIIWGKYDYGWSSVEVIGRSRGILTIWMRHKFCSNFSFKGKGYLGVNGLWKGTNCYIVNVYSSCNNVEKRRLWSKLVQLKNNFPKGEWEVGGLQCHQAGG